jgi:hypothetical protein
MDKAAQAAREILRRERGKNARRAVSRKLALYHQTLLDTLSGDTNSFFERVMERAQHDISLHSSERPMPPASGRQKP